MNQPIHPRSNPFKVRFTRHGILIERAFLQSLLNIFFEDSKAPEAVLCVDAHDSDHPRIYSEVRSA